MPRQDPTFTLWEWEGEDGWSEATPGPSDAQDRGPACLPGLLTSMGTGSQEVDYVLVLAQVAHDLQL